jgi:hypothetical protein
MFLVVDGCVPIAVGAYKVAPTALVTLVAPVEAIVILVPE